MDRAPKAYEPTYETRIESPEATTVVNTAFLKSKSGILKLCEIVLSCVVLICVACTKHWSSDSSGGWVNFVVAFSLVVCGLFYVFYVFNVIRRLPGPWVIIEFATLILLTLMWTITVVVCFAHHYFGGGAIAAGIFSIFMLAILIVELGTRFRVTRENNVFRITIAAVRTVPPTFPAPVTHAAPPPTTVTTAGGYPGGGMDEGYVMP